MFVSQWWFMVERQAHNDSQLPVFVPGRSNTVAIAGGLSSFSLWRLNHRIHSLETTDTFLYNDRECLITQQEAWHDSLTDTYGIMISLVDIDTKERFVIHFNGQ